MTYGQRYAGKLEYDDAGAFADALRALVDEEGCDFSECALGRDELVLDGAGALVVDVDGTFPASCFDITVFVLGYLGQRAARGMIECTFEGGDVERVGPDAPDED